MLKNKFQNEIDEIKNHTLEIPNMERIQLMIKYAVDNIKFPEYTKP
jgi:hypothetical protein